MVLTYFARALADDLNLPRALPVLWRVLRADAPGWMQRCGLTWLHRMASEPRRLIGRYLHHNSLFLGYLLWDTLRGAVFHPESSRRKTRGG